MVTIKIGLRVLFGLAAYLSVAPAQAAVAAQLCQATDSEGTSLVVRIERLAQGVKLSSDRVAPNRFQPFAWGATSEEALTQFNATPGKGRKLAASLRSKASPSERLVLSIDASGRGSLIKETRSSVPGQELIKESLLDLTNCG